MTGPAFAGRCYCGDCQITARSEPEAVSWCHCADCRRLTGAPAAAFAAFPEEAVTLTPTPTPLEATPGVTRWACPRCGSALAARFSYLPGQLYLPLGVLDAADSLAPALHSHHASRLSWLHIADDAPRHAGTARDALSDEALSGSEE
ncbi:GFA family protein [Oceanicola sp. 502str15]|uniref:GFA family protein n=1 Tax=Oceanicola sp. 502str15 TaxID=2696061 RepID=UPI00209430CB